MKYVTSRKAIIIKLLRYVISFPYGNWVATLDYRLLYCLLRWYTNALCSYATVQLRYSTCTYSFFCPVLYTKLVICFSNIQTRSSIIGGCRVGYLRAMPTSVSPFCHESYSFVACFSRVFAVLAEFEVFVECSRHVFHTLDFSSFSQSRLSHWCKPRHACAFVSCQFWICIVVISHPSWLHYRRALFFRGLYISRITRFCVFSWILSTRKLVN